MRVLEVITLVLGLVWSLECHSSQCSAGRQHQATLDDTTVQPTITRSSGPSLESAFPIQLGINLQIGDLSGSGTVRLTKVDPTSSSLVWEDTLAWIPSASASGQIEDWSAAYITPTLRVLGADTTSSTKTTLGIGNLTRSSSSFPTPTALNTVTNGAGDTRTWTIISLVLWQIAVSGLIW